MTKWYPHTVPAKPIFSKYFFPFYDFQECVKPLKLEAENHSNEHNKIINIWRPAALLRCPNGERFSKSNTRIFLQLVPSRLSGLETSILNCWDPSGKLELSSHCLGHVLSNPCFSPYKTWGLNMCGKRTSHKPVENVCVWFSLTGKEFKDVPLTLTTKHSASFLFSHLNS